MRIYVIGPVTGRENQNAPAFASAMERLTAAGHDVSTPLDFVPPSATHEEAMRMSLCWLLHTGRIEAVATLGDWELSPGARVEREAALACGIPCGPVEAWEAMGV